MSFKQFSGGGKLAELLRKTDDNKQLGEAAIGNDQILVFPGDVPASGDAVIIRDAAGAESVPADGDYTTENGWNITISDGIIVEAVEPQQEEEMNEEQEQVNELNSELSEMNKELIQLLKEQKQELAATRAEIKELKDMTPAAKPASTASNNGDGKAKNTKLGGDRKYSKEALLHYVKSYKEIRKNPVKFKALQNEYKFKNGFDNRMQFGPGWDLAGVLARCKDYMQDITYLTIVSDGLLSMFNNITDQATGSRINKYNVLIPRLDYSLNEDLWQQIAKTCGFNPQDDFIPTQREVEVHGIQYEHEQCAIDVRDVWNGMIYNGEDEIPAEAVAMTMLIERLTRDLEKIALYGRGNIKGLFKEIQDAVIAACIPAAQSITQAPYTVANAIDQIEELIDAVPPFLRANTDLLAMVQYNLPSLYYRNYRTAFGAPPQFGYPLAPQEGMMELIPDTPFPVAWAKSYSQGLVPVGTDIANITFPDNVYYVLERGGGADDFDMWYEQAEQLIRLRWRNCFGINFALCEGIVTNITAATVLP